MGRGGSAANKDRVSPCVRIELEKDMTQKYGSGMSRYTYEWRSYSRCGVNMRGERNRIRLDRFVLVGLIYALTTFQLADLIRPYVWICEVCVEKHH